MNETVTRTSEEDSTKQYDDAAERCSHSDSRAWITSVRNSSNVHLWLHSPRLC